MNRTLRLSSVGSAHKPWFDVGRLTMIRNIRMSMNTFLLTRLEFELIGIIFGIGGYRLIRITSYNTEDMGMI